MNNLIKTIHNVETGEITEREMTSQEIAQQEKDEIEFAQLKAEAQAKAQAKAALLERLGLTQEEFNTLIA